MAFIFSLSRRHENFSQSSGFLTLLHASCIPFFNHSSNQHETSLGLKGVQYGSHVSVLIHKSPSSKLCILKSTYTYRINCSYLTKLTCSNYFMVTILNALMGCETWLTCMRASKLKKKKNNK